MKSPSMRERFVAVMTELLDSGKDVALITADITYAQFRANGAHARHPDRVINVGIREGLMVDVAAGMALAGVRSVAHTFAPFLIERAFEQVKLGFAHQGVGGVLVSVGASHDVAAYGRTHHSPGDVALVSTLPGWRIHVPGHADEAEAFLRDAVARDEPVYIRLTERANSEPVSHADTLAPMRRGSPGAPTVIAIGPMLDAVLEATTGIDATVLYMATVRPFDASGLRATITGADVVLIEPYLEGTSSAEVSKALNDRPHRLLSIGVPNVEHRKYGRAAEYDAAFGLDAGGLRTRMLEWLPAAMTAGVGSQ
jgi:transketolase